MASRHSQGVQRVITKLQASINSGNYYEAHQMYRTIYFRLALSLILLLHTILKLLLLLFLFLLLFLIEPYLFQVSGTEEIFGFVGIIVQWIYASITTRTGIVIVNLIWSLSNSRFSIIFRNC